MEPAGNTLRQIENRMKFNFYLTVLLSAVSKVIREQKKDIKGTVYDIITTYFEFKGTVWDKKALILMMLA